ncbi:MAG: EAL domain-containing protein [Acidobacteriaceae bacterium]
MDTPADTAALGQSVESAVLKNGVAFGIASGDPASSHHLSETPPQHIHEVLSAILLHDPLTSILQRVADAFVALYPSKGAAIFVLSGQNFQIAAEAGLPPRPLRGSGGSSPVPDVDLSSDFPQLVPILETGINLSNATPLVSSSGQVRGAFTVFDFKPGPPDELTRDTIQSLCSLAQVAMQHGQLYEEVVYHSQFDRLTGLPNRLLLQDRIGQAIVVAKRQGALVAVCSIDLDAFKQINDSLSHDIGDIVIKLISERLNASIRDVDTLARGGGDEFILLLRNLTQASEATAICERLLKDLEAPFLLHDRSLQVTASMGISIFPNHGDSTDLLLRNADLALRAAKDTGRARIQTYSQTLGLETRRSQELAGALANALAQTQFRLVYQPIFNLDKEILGFEALLRWKHPRWGQIGPLEFIPTAEKSGLIVAIGDWVIQEVCRQAMEWNALDVPPVKLFVNISGVQLQRPDFSAKVAAALKMSGLPPDRVELEVTESWIVSDLPTAAAGLRELCNLGTGIAIDDFGTGYATFNYLQELPFDMLKIDRSFIHRLDGSSGNLSTVRGIVMLARQLGLKTIAEGVESEQQLRQLSEIGCDFIQGYFLSLPLEAEAARSLLLEHRSTMSA